MHCGKSAVLESAHIKDRSRKQIISNILRAPTPNYILTIDLQDFWKSFREEHKPIERAFLVLCKSCHKVYDNKLILGHINSDIPIPESKNREYSKADILPITFSQYPVSEFKKLLLQKRRAIITIYYQDRRVVQHCWNAMRLSEKSDIIHNVRSRPYTRRSSWQSNEIVKVHVSL